MSIKELKEQYGYTFQYVRCCINCQYCSFHAKQEPICNYFEGEKILVDFLAKCSNFDPITPF